MKKLKEGGSKDGELERLIKDLMGQRQDLEDELRYKDKLISELRGKMEESKINL